MLQDTYDGSDNQQYYCSRHIQLLKSVKNLITAEMVYITKVSCCRNSKIVFKDTKGEAVCCAYAVVRICGCYTVSQTGFTV